MEKIVFYIVIRKEKRLVFVVSQLQKTNITFLWRFVIKQSYFFQRVITPTHFQSPSPKSNHPCSPPSAQNIPPPTPTHPHLSIKNVHPPPLTQSILPPAHPHPPIKNVYPPLLTQNIPPTTSTQPHPPMRNVHPPKISLDPLPSHKHTILSLLYLSKGE